MLLSSCLPRGDDCTSSPSPYLCHPRIFVIPVKTGIQSFLHPVFKLKFSWAPACHRGRQEKT
ncbi:MAG: hypothetical protein A2977_00490 [Alphaproteobacteria bacterium RIFCSPLOWO2_01_FULL_45_8]|nr:MAG: hypothetical protein A2065_00510 [Alphaproteobacteria bacterium GWB1_45_5]OFW76569.1 MAG: hypothetical protein A3K20_00075 [Alphaproteobacteria bacterium GWA1_45_9]OFW89653.1 MAG: hypothetical protein A2621_01965 [Alphaproteobacteria bacterium RIFCSPHIGHO2_01_FULL_41_14]OFW96566.1 MAG: hypothetical protein A2977_00490 [Alphaproteobacteria bacterium RIFCSPLOWO2_01_FULL_45_8]HCI49093.1 hypothetical protein [Holosporales bacterium]